MSYRYDRTGERIDQDVEADDQADERTPERPATRQPRPNVASSEPRRCRHGAPIAADGTCCPIHADHREVVA